MKLLTVTVLTLHLDQIKFRLYGLFTNNVTQGLLDAETTVPKPA